MAIELTVKERAFAELIVEGSKSAAYRTVYSANGSPATQATNAYKLSRKPKIKAEVARLLRQRAFPADDYKRLQETAIAGLTEIFLSDSDSRVRLKAASILLSYADAGLKLHGEASAKDPAYDSSERTQIIAELRGLYAKAGLTGPVEDAGPQHRQAMEREPEQALMVEPAEEEAEPLLEVEAEAERAGRQDEPPAAGKPATVDVSLAGEKLNPPVQFRMERIPGHFGPAQYRRVRIEP